MKYNVSYALKADSNDLFAYVKEINVILHFYNNEWNSLKENVEKFFSSITYEDISFNEALDYTYGMPPHRTFKYLGFDTYDKDDVPSMKELFDTVKNFINQRRSFAVSDYYTMEHNKEQSLRYSAKELDAHYMSDINKFLCSHYYEFMNRKLKNEFDYVVIYPDNDDYIIEFDKTILI